MIFLILTLLWMSVIFYMSAKNAEESTHMSHSVGLKIGDVFIPDFEQWNKEAQIAFAEKIEVPVRKGAHMAEFAALGLFLFGAVYSSARKKSAQAGVCILLGVLYAATDEFHQLFVPGRAGMIQDVLIDGIGVCVGVCAAYWIALWRNGRCC